MLPVKHGASAMAIRTKSPILPMMIYKKPKWFRKTHILIGEPIEFTEYYDKKLTDEDFDAADEKLLQIMLALREEHTKFLENKKKKGKK
jgi:1-acyl-sn-glycerol-3-phosphate acyltransferase